MGFVCSILAFISMDDRPTLLDVFGAEWMNIGVALAWVMMFCLGRAILTLWRYARGEGSRGFPIDTDS